MSTTLLLKRLRIENKEFVAAEDIRTYCRSMKIKYDAAIRYFIKKGYLTRIFRGIFYVKSFEELKLGRTKYTQLELVAKGMELKNVKHWYFGLHTALKMNNMTHEHFTIEEVISDSIFRARPIKIAGHGFKFVKLSNSLFNFGVITNNGTRYSDPEKTILDFIYVWRYNGVPEYKILADISEWSKGTSKSKLSKYAKNYPSTVFNLAKRVSQ
ncbi:MAG: type IV toxin-antitoxin system AbiEi family antitoxin domain-containing protein [Nitrososphaerales archaeon]